MAGGLVVFGVAGYAFVAVTGWTLDKSEANLAIAFYFLTNVIGPGIFYAIEQVTSRSTSRALAAGLPLGPALRRVRRAGVGLVAVIMAVLVLLAPVMVGATLHGDWVLFGAVLATPAITAALSLIRGEMAGRQRFDRYAGTLAIEGAARLALCLLLALAGTDVAWIFGVGFLGASVIAVGIGWLWSRGDARGEAGAEAGVTVDTAEGQAAGTEDGQVGTGGGERYPPVGRGLAALALATLFAQLLPNIAPLVVTSRLAQDSAVALAFGQAAVMARIPLLLFSPVQTMLLPGLTAAVTKGELRTVARRVALTLAVIGVFGSLAVVVFVLLGPWVLRTFLNTTTDLGTPILLLLATSTVVLIAAYAGQPALVALGRDGVVTAGWALGTAVTLVLALLPGDVVSLGAGGQLAGPVLTLVVVLLGLRAGLRAAANERPGLVAARGER